MALVLVTGPETEPIDLDDAKRHCRLDDDFLADDALVLGLIQAAREYVESVTNRALVSQAWRLTLDRFPCDDTIPLCRPPVTGVTTFTYVASDGAVAPFTDYTLDADSFPGRIVRSTDAGWPTTRVQRNAVAITFAAGYAPKPPAPILAAMRLLIGAWYENREAVSVGNVSAVPMAVDALLGQYRRYAEEMA